MYYYSLFLEHPNSFNQYITRKKAKKQTLNINEAELAHKGKVSFSLLSSFKKQKKNTKTHRNILV